MQHALPILAQVLSGKVGHASKRCSACFALCATHKLYVIAKYDSDDQRFGTACTQRAKATKCYKSMDVHVL